MKGLAAFLANAVLVLVLAVSVIFFSYFFTSLGILSLPSQIWEAPLSLLTPRPAAVTITVPTRAAPRAASTSGPEVFHTQPAETPELAQVELPTPVPPLSAEGYRAAVMNNLRAFARALQDWLDANDRLAADPALAADFDWQVKTSLLADRVLSAARDLAAIGPAPAEYAAVEARLQPVLPEAEALWQNYQSALQTGDAGLFEAAAGNFDAIKDLLTLLVGEMHAAGWPFEE